MANKNWYHIKIVFDKKRPECAEPPSYHEYSSKYPYKDTFVFLPNEFSIVAGRSKIYNIDQILHNSNSSIYKQIFKGLLYYYARSNDRPIVEKIEVIRRSHNQRTEDVVVSMLKPQILQPIDNAIDTSLRFQASSLGVLFEETDKGDAIRKALSYWLKGMSSKEKFYRFERLWRAFNCIYRYNSPCLDDHKQQRDIRKLIIANESLLVETCREIQTFNHQKLRSLRWRALILNDYSTIKSTESFKEFVKRYSDGRIKALFKEILSYRKDNLLAKGLFTEVDNHLNAPTTNCDGELISLIAIKYTYFVRNKMFHGEIPESSFKLQLNNEDNEINILNTILENLVFELICNHNVLN